MPEQDIVSLKVELAKLQTELKGHTESSIGFRNDIKEMLCVIQKDIKYVNNGIPARQEVCYQRAKKNTAFVVKLWLGIPITITSLILCVVWVIKMYHSLL